MRRGRSVNLPNIGERLFKGEASVAGKTFETASTFYKSSGFETMAVKNGLERKWKDFEHVMENKEEKETENKKKERIIEKR